MFNVGDKVVYPNHGVGTIDGISEFVIDDQVHTFFTVSIQSSKSTVKVPAGNAEVVGLRHLITKKQIQGVYSYLRTGEIVKYADWKERFKQNSDLMRTGKIDDMASVLKNLHAVSSEKPLSFREKRMYDRALDLVASEIAEVNKTTTREVEESLFKAMGKSLKKKEVKE